MRVVQVPTTLAVCLTAILVGCGDDSTAGEGRTADPAAQDASRSPPAERDAGSATDVHDDAGAALCAARTLEACEDHVCEVWKGFRIAGGQAPCHEATPQSATCGPRRGVCQEYHRCGTAPDDTRWLFGACLPPGFVEFACDELTMCPSGGSLVINRRMRRTSRSPQPIR